MRVTNYRGNFIVQIGIKDHTHPLEDGGVFIRFGFPQSFDRSSKKKREGEFSLFAWLMPVSSSHKARLHHLEIAK